MKKYRCKAVGFLLIGVVSLIGGCKSLLSGFKSTAFRSDCEWIEFPYQFRCDYFITNPELRELDPETAPSPMGARRRVLQMKEAL